MMEKVYLHYRKEFVNWSTGKFGIPESEALDHYQDTMTIFFEKVLNGDLKQLESSLKTYLFGIGKNKVRQQFDEQKRKERHEEGLAEHYHFMASDNGLSEEYELARSQTRKMFDGLGEACKQILRLFYYEKKSMSEIADLLGHKSEGVSRTTKKRCLEKLRTKVTKPLTDG